MSHKFTRTPLLHPPIVFHGFTGSKKNNWLCAWQTLTDVIQGSLFPCTWDNPQDFPPLSSTSRKLSKCWEERKAFGLPKSQSQSRGENNLSTRFDNIFCYQGTQGTTGSIFLVPAFTHYKPEAACLMTSITTARHSCNKRKFCGVHFSILGKVYFWGRTGTESTTKVGWWCSAARCQIPAWFRAIKAIRYSRELWPPPSSFSRSPTRICARNAADPPLQSNPNRPLCTLFQVPSRDDP